MINENLTFLDENGEILFQQEDIPQYKGLTITELASVGRYKMLEKIAEKLSNYEQGVSENVRNKNYIYAVWHEYECERFSINDVNFFIEIEDALSEFNRLKDEFLYDDEFEIEDEFDKEDVTDADNTIAFIHKPSNIKAELHIQKIKLN